MAAAAPPKKKTAPKSAKPAPAKSSPKPRQQAATTVLEDRAARRKQWRTAIGLLVLISGLYLGVALVSYLWTWKEDSDLFFSSVRIKEFLANDSAPVANLGGRLGAFLGHKLIYNGAGIASIILALWLANFGLRLIYGGRLRAVMRYLRWAALALLVAGPVMAFLIPGAEFPWGGAWGDQANQYLSGLIGRSGLGLVLGGIVLFVVITVFALDVAPMLRKARAASRRVRTGLADRLQAAAASAVAVSERAAASTPENPVSVPDKATGEQENQVSARPSQATPTPPKQYDMVLEERQSAQPEPPAEAILESQEDSDTALSDEEAAYQAFLAEQARANQATREKKVEPALDFEVVKAHEEPAPAVAHGAHISIESGEPYAPELDLPNYRFPTLDLLPDRGHEAVAMDVEELDRNKNQIVQTLRSFGIEIQRISATVGPTVTLYEVIPAEGVRISKIRNLEDDIALNLAALGIRIIAPIPGRGTIGIEVPNANKQVVGMRTLLASEKFVNNKMSLPIALGKKIDNENYIVDLATMPHLLMAGATGQGKSVGINAILVSLLYKKHPSQLKFVLVDPKKVELSIYRLIEKHFLAKLPNEEEPIITDTKKVIHTLNALCIEMDNRYDLLKEAGARNIKEYNDKFIARRLNPQNGHKFLPFIVLVVDEFADLIMTAGKEVEMPIARLAQLARAVGIHLIIATQRPSVNVITGTIKANFPARVAFKVSSKIDSRTILDASGAEQLIGRGDMLVSHGSELLRLQCAFVDTPEVEEIVDFIGKQRGYPTAHELPEYEGAEDEEAGRKNVDLTNRDKMFEESARLVVATQLGSTSNIQRKFNLGYNRAGRIMDQLEAAGIVGPTNGSKPREVLIKTEYELEDFLQTLV